MSKLPRHPKDRGYGYLKACEYPEAQSGFASFSMHELAELITNVHLVDTKPIQNDIQNDTRTKHIRNIRTDKV